MPVSKPVVSKPESPYVTAILLLFLLPWLAACLESPEGSLKVGAKAPSIRTVKLSDVGGDFSRITTYRYPDERMYQYSLDEALQLGKTIVLEFATPGHCTVCDKQLQMLKSILNEYGDKIVILHMDQYQNPGAFIAFRVKGDPWTFVIDKEGIVRFKRPGRMLYQELDFVLAKIVEEQ